MYVTTPNNEIARTKYVRDPRSIETRDAARDAQISDLVSREDPRLELDRERDTGPCLSIRTHISTGERVKHERGV